MAKYLTFECQVLEKPKIALSKCLYKPNFYEKQPNTNFSQSITKSLDLKAIEVINYCVMLLLFSLETEPVNVKSS